jgi:hypothetical protein
MSVVLDLDWDTWREQYDSMTFADQQQFYLRVASLYPLQESANVSMADEAFNRIKERSVRAHHIIVELGGWNGRLANSMLQRPDVAFWKNYDIVGVPQACAAPGYRRVVLRDWFWNKRHKADVFVAAHTIEHLSRRDLGLLFDCLDVRWIYLDAPLDRGPRDWTGYSGSHVLEIGWDGVAEMLEARGYKAIIEPTLWERQQAGVS